MFGSRPPHAELKAMRKPIPADCFWVLMSLISLPATASDEGSDVSVQCELTSCSLMEKASELRQSSNAPALSAAVVLQGAVIAKATVGVRAEGGAPARDFDAWHIGSVTKAITATLTARLVERGQLRFSSSLEELGAELLSPKERAYATVTVRELLSHRSGIAKIPEEEGMDLFRSDTRTLPEQRHSFAKSFLSRAPFAPPGSEFAYANGNYIVMGALLERLSKDSWEDMVVKEVFVPLGLRSAGFGAPGGGHPSKAPVGHEFIDKRARPVQPGERADNPEVIGPAGRIHMTMEDLALFGYRHAAGEFEADGYLSTDTYRLLHTDQGDGAAMGWFVQQWRGHRLLSHTGSNGYWYSMLAVQPEKRLAIAVAANVNPDGGADVAVHELISALTRSAILGECLNRR
jgi:CubicO group peptidase (beta-lactamase class C family)